MTIVEIINKLRQEREIGSRFPARMIFVEDLSIYFDLVAQLKSACDVTINIADFSKKDVVPQFDKIRNALSQYVDKQILLLSVGEYLRMCIKRELNKERAQFPSFWEAMQQEDSRTRVIMPVFCCRDSFDRIIGKIDERQESFLWSVEKKTEKFTEPMDVVAWNLSKTHFVLCDKDVPCESTKKYYKILIYSPEFAQAINADADDFESWLRNWDTILWRNLPCTVITNQYRNVEASYGTVSLNPIGNPFSYLCDLLKDSNCFEQSWEPESFWAQLIPFVKRGMTVEELILDQLNVTRFDFASIIARWRMLNPLQKELLWMWYRIFPSSEYFSYACKKSVRAAEIPERIRDEILFVSTRSDKWIKERMNAMQVLSFVSFDDDYFKLLDKVTLPDTKLQLLTYKTHEECAYAVKIVSGLLRDGVDTEAISEMLHDKYPVLITYLSSESGLDTEVDEYLDWYRRNKITNRFPGNYAKRMNFDRFDSRFKIFSKMQGKDCFTFWIDGFGMEWMPVFLHELELRGITPDKKYIVKSKLPTETEYNHRWDEKDPMSIKWNRLDTLSHKGMPDDKSYFSCIVYQLAVFADAAKKVDELLDEHEYVLITGDHGSSRLAALGFHDDSIVPVSVPLQAKVRSFGRFCEFEKDGEDYIALDYMTKINIDGKVYVVMNDYSKFSISGNAAGGNSDEQDVVGEVHGGNTLEERLVPVIIVKRSQPLPQLTCKPKSKNATKKNGHVEISLTFNRAVFTLEVSNELSAGIVSKKQDDSWDVIFDGITDDSLELTVVANGNLLSEKILIKLKSQGIEKNAGMGGLP